jgi:ribosome-binding factor A
MHSYFRRKLAGELKIRKAPQLIFEEDKAIKRSLEIEKIIKEIENK